MIPILHRESPIISIFLQAPDSTYHKIEHTLLDSGAGMNTITRRVITKLNLTPTLLAHPFKASAAGNNEAIHTHEIALDVTISGVKQKLFCYVDEIDHHFNFLIGMPGLAQLRMHMEFAAGPCAETLVSMKREVEGGGFEHVVVGCVPKRRPFGELGIGKVVSAEEKAEVMARGESVGEWKAQRKGEVERFAGMLSGMMPGFLEGGRSWGMRVRDEKVVEPLRYC